jgi:UDP-N-acetylglucosamine 3-dehydrogenase
VSNPRGIVVGLGRMGSYHLRVLSAHPGADVAAIVEPDAGRRATAPSGTPAFASLTDALEIVEADFACIATPPRSLPATAHEALGAGLAVMLEKPMGVDEDSAWRIVRDAETRELLLAVGLVERCNPAVAALRMMLDGRTAGQIHQVHARRLSPHPGRQSPVGVALDLATHDLDVIRFITHSEFDRVYAETAALGGGTGEDLVSATVRMDSGTTALIDVNWLTPTKVRQLSVTCEGGLFVVDYLTQDLTFYQHPRSDNEWDILRMMRGTGEGDMLRYGIARREPLVIQWDMFLAALAGDGEPAATGRDGIAALSIARAIQQSGADHVPVVPAYRKVAVQ